MKIRLIARENIMRPDNTPHDDFGLLALDGIKLSDVLSISNTTKSIGNAICTFKQNCGLKYIASIEIIFLPDDALSF